MGRVAGVVIATGSAALALAGPAWAGSIVEDHYIEVPQCQPATSQLCPQVPSVTSGVVGLAPTLTFTASSNHCSHITAHIIVDGAEVGSAVVGPGQTTPVFELASYRSHTVGVQAEGIEGGCNHGALSSWGGNLHLEWVAALGVTHAIESHLAQRATQIATSIVKAANSTKTGQHREQSVDSSDTSVLRALLKLDPHARVS
jgi:hypothetical protein